MDGLIEFLIALLIVIGAFFLFVGSLALARLPDTMQRLHGPSKSTTLGIGAMLIASMLFFLAKQGNPSVEEFLISLFLFLTAPVTAHMVAKAHMLRDARLRAELPPTGSAAGWATFAAPETSQHSLGPGNRPSRPSPDKGASGRASRERAP